MVNTKVVDLFEINNFSFQDFFHIVYFGGKIESLIFIKMFFKNKRKDITPIEKLFVANL